MLKSVHLKKITCYKKLKLLVLMVEEQKATENMLNTGKYAVISGSAMLGDAAYDRR